MAVTPAAAPGAFEDPAPSTVESNATAFPDATTTYGRRTQAVTAYCRELDPAGQAAAAASWILSSLTEAISDDNVLLRETRPAAAKQVAGRQPEITGEECAATPARLADRANGSLIGAERSAFEQHLASCLPCRAAELRFRRAERAFAAILGLTLTTNH